MLCYLGKNSFSKQRILDSLFKPRTQTMGIVGYDYGWTTAYDPYLRKVNFNFGASSGATSALIIYPNRKTVIAIAANLGPAKFPYNRLMNIVNSSVEKPALIFYNIFAIVAILCLLWQIKTLLAKFKNKKNENNWFKQPGWMYMLVHFMGIVVTLLVIVFPVPVYMAVTRNGHSVSDDLYEMFIYITCTAFW